MSRIRALVGCAIALGLGACSGGGGAAGTGGVGGQKAGSGGATGTGGGAIGTGGAISTGGAIAATGGRGAGGAGNSGGGATGGTGAGGAGNGGGGATGGTGRGGGTSTGGTAGMPGAGGSGAAGRSGGGAGGAVASGGAGGGATSCACFGHGQWRIDNLSPCFYSSSPTGSPPDGAVSTFISGNLSMCPSSFSMAPTQPWSTDALTIDCAGHYRLCLTLKAGSVSAPLPADCVVAQSCAEGDDTTPNQSQAWPPLPSWITMGASQTACAQAFYSGGGYGEMTVTGTPVGCGAITKTFARVSYCPLTCNGNPNAPGCPGCMPTGNGSF